MIVVAVNNASTYTERLLALLSSVAVNSPADRIRAYLINCPLAYGRSLSRVHPAVEVVHRAMPTDISQETVRVRMAGYRSSLLVECLQEGIAKVAWLDVDTLVRARLDGLWEPVEPSTLHILHRRHAKHANARFQSGVFALGNSSAAQAFVRDYDQAVRYASDWYADQRELYQCYVRWRSQIRLAPLHERYNDTCQFRFDSVVWHSKARRFNCDPFRQEYRRYLALAQDRLKAPPGEAEPRGEA